MTKKEVFFSPLGICFIYIILSALVSLGFRMIFPGEAVPLTRFSFSWHLVQGLLEYLSLFPALILSALVIPFGFKIQAREKITPYSPQFLQSLKGSIITAIVGAVLYGILFSLALPLARDYETDLRNKGRLYRLAKERAIEHAAKGEWAETAQFLAVCESIWPKGPEVAKLKIETDIRTEGERMAQGPLPNKKPMDSTSGLPGPQPLGAIEALSLAEKALGEERYFDAHWLASMAGRLAKPGSVESAQARRLAGMAWNGVNSLAPNARETVAYNIYKLKREGYEALNSEEWIRAYYIFLELLSLSPDDPDALKYFALSEEGLRQVAFFIDEMDMTLGKILTGAVFSLPAGGAGRLVIRVASLSILPDSAYGIGVEILAFDRDGQCLWSMEAPYAKIIPLALNRGKDGSGPGVSILLRSLNRTDKNHRWEPLVVYFGQSPKQSGPGSTQVALSISWDNFLLLSNIHRGLSVLSAVDLKNAAENLGSCGYLPQTFEVELIRRFAQPLLLLPLGIIAIIVGWRYRAMKRPRYVGILMLGILPLVFSGMINLLRGWVTNLIILAVVSLGFTTAAVIFVVGITVLLVLFLIILAAQHG